MSPLIGAGVGCVMLALVAYSIGIAMLQNELRVSPRVMRLLGIGLLLDVLAMACMMLMADSRGLTLHGVVGYSACVGMGAVTLWAWRHRHGVERVSRAVVLWSRIAYGYWLLAFLSGMALGLSARAARAASVTALR